MTADPDAIAAHLLVVKAHQDFLRRRREEIDADMATEGLIKTTVAAWGETPKPRPAAVYWRWAGGSSPDFHRVEIRSAYLPTWSRSWSLYDHAGGLKLASANDPIYVRTS